MSLHDIAAAASDKAMDTADVGSRPDMIDGRDEALDRMAAIAACFCCGGGLDDGRDEALDRQAVAVCGVPFRPADVAPGLECDALADHALDRANAAAGCVSCWTGPESARLVEPTADLADVALDRCVVAGVCGGLPGNIEGLATRSADGTDEYSGNVSRISWPTTEATVPAPRRMGH